MAVAEMEAENAPFHSGEQVIAAGRLCPMLNGRELCLKPCQKNFRSLIRLLLKIRVKECQMLLTSRSPQRGFMETANQLDFLGYRPEVAKSESRSLWSLRTNVDGNDLSLSITRAICGGALLGLGWGILFRLWMRLVSDKPEFTLSGTSMLLGAATFVGGCAGLAYAIRRRGTTKRVWIPRLVSVLAFVALGIGPGIFVVPTILFATLAVARTNWNRWLRAVCALLALAGFGVVARIMLNFWPPLQSAIYLLLYLPFMYPPIIAMRMGLQVRAKRATGSEALNRVHP